MPMYDHITDQQAELIRQSKMFFVASVHPELTDGPAGEGAVNLSPKGGVPLYILDQHTVAYLDYPGSGNETARHASDNGPTTIMVMSMDDDAAIVRLYGHATVQPIEESPLADQLLATPAQISGKPRQIITLTVDCTQTSCGYGVPLYDYVGDRSKEQRGRRYK
ncbi:MAG: pyridoxamine 5'-phosphate oxidase family protein [Anaerolineae bacterium]|nr:pyridoxamine 5'-phosphate oxidase family protein [Anaerolineae bacterium]